MLLTYHALYAMDVITVSHGCSNEPIIISSSDLKGFSVFVPVSVVPVENFTDLKS